jgi:hypothetical protein
MEALGGRMESLYYAFGSHDGCVIADLPDNVAATALAIAVNQTGLVTASTVVLITADEMDRAAKKAVRYRAPGQKKLAPAKTKRTAPPRSASLSISRRRSNDAGCPDSGCGSRQRGLATITVSNDASPLASSSVVPC